METTNSNYFGTEKISRILLKIAPPVMLAQLIQALYNIVDSLFVGKYSESGLTALSIIYPLQLLMIAIAVGTGVGINTAMAHYLGVHDEKKANEYGGIGTPLTLVLWALFAVVCFVCMPVYARMSTDSPEVIRNVIVYGRIVCVFSIGLFTESIWTKILQANGDMRTPMIAQIVGALVNIALDPLFIFGMFGLPKLGIAVTALGLYYKWQSFFFIPLGALQTCIVPVISYNYASGQMDRCKKTLSTSLVGGMGLMFIGTLVFNLIPGQMLRVFTSDPQVIAIGTVGFHFVGISFIPMVTSLIFPVFFQAVGAAVKSSLLTVVRTVVLFVPLGYLFSRLGLNDFWFTFPVTEVITTLVGVFFYRRFMAQQK